MLGGKVWWEGKVDRFDGRLGRKVGLEGCMGRLVGEVWWEGKMGRFDGRLNGKVGCKGWIGRLGSKIGCEF